MGKSTFVNVTPGMGASEVVVLCSEAATKALEAVSKQKVYELAHALLFTYHFLQIARVSQDDNEEVKAVLTDKIELLEQVLDAAGLGVEAVIIKNRV